MKFFWISRVKTKMEFQIASDLHIEKKYPKVPKITDYITPKAPRLILAGDVGRVEYWDQYSAFIVGVCHHFKNVILIAGNYEYYTKDPNLTMEKVDRKLKGLENLSPNLRVLQNETYSLGKKLIIFGATFWSQLPPKVVLGLPIYTAPGVKITSSYYSMLHFQSRVKLEEMINRTQNLDLVVISHHAPTFEGTLASKYRKNYPKNTLYCSHMEEYLTSKKVSTWIYGHTGYNTDIVLPENTRLVSNQMEAKDSDKGCVLTFEIF